MPEQPFYTSRREFLAGSLTFLSAAGALPVFLGDTSRALADARPAAKRENADHRILVVVQLAGGNDGLNTVVPYEQDGYYKPRPRLAIAGKDTLKLKDGLGLHPAATGLKELYDAGMLAIVQGVGYPNPNRSHFSSMDIWQTADPTLRAREGWLGRYFDARGKGADPDPIQGVALMQEAPQALQGDRFTPLAFENADALAWRAGRRDNAALKAFKKLNNIDGDLPTVEGDTARFLQHAALEALVGADEIRSASGSSIRGGRRRRGGGGELSRSLDMVARMIAADLPTRVYYVSLGGFDTHTNQQTRQRNLMRELGDALLGFVDSLRENKLLDRALVMSFSEFGRRVEENASGGTDHGEAAPMLLLGGKVRPGLHGKHPNLSRLHRGDLAFSCDFRRVYAAVLRDWLKIRPSQVLKGAFSPLKIIKA